MIRRQRALFASAPASVFCIARCRSVATVAPRTLLSNAQHRTSPTSISRASGVEPASVHRHVVFQQGIVAAKRKHGTRGTTPTSPAQSTLAITFQQSHFENTSTSAMNCSAQAAGYRVVPSGIIDMISRALTISRNKLIEACAGDRLSVLEIPRLKILQGDIKKMDMFMAWMCLPAFKRRHLWASPINAKYCQVWSLKPRSSEERAARHTYFHNRRESNIRKISLSQNTFSIKVKGAITGEIIKIMAVPRKELEGRKHVAYNEKMKIQNYWNPQNLVRCIGVQSNYKLLSARKKFLRKQWAPFVREIASSQKRSSAETQWTPANIALFMSHQTIRQRRICRILNTPLFSLTRHRRRREVRNLRRQIPPIIDTKETSPSWKLPNTATPLGRVGGLLVFEKDGHDVKSNDVSAHDKVNYCFTRRRLVGGRIRLSPSPRMWASNVAVHFNELPMNHRAGSHESQVDGWSNAHDSSAYANNSPDYEKNDLEQEQDFLLSNDAMSDVSDYSGDWKQENASSDESDIDGEMDDEQEIHIPLSFQIPEDTLREAMQASSNSQASFYSHRLYRGPEDQLLPVHYCRSMEVAEKVAKYFVAEKVLGFDIEWKPWASPNSIKDNASLIQIASEDRIALFHISLFSGSTADELLPPTLKTVLEDADICKVGVAIKGDFTRLQNHLGVKARGVFEISRLHNLVEHHATPEKINKRLVSLARQTKQHLQLPLFKGDVRESDWSKQLNADQLRYAATDAYAGLRIFDVLEAKRKMLKPTPPLPDCCDSDDKPRPRSKAASKPTAIAKEEDDATKAAQDQSEEDADAYQTAQEDFMDSHELEAMSINSDSTSEGSEQSNHPDTAFELPSQRIGQPPVDQDHQNIGAATRLPKTRRVGHVNISRLTGFNPGYPKLPQLASQEELGSHSSDTFDPLKPRLRRHAVKDVPMDDELRDVDNNVAALSKDKELMELLSSMTVDNVLTSSFASEDVQMGEDDNIPPRGTRGPVQKQKKDGGQTIDPTSVPLAKKKKSRTSHSIDSIPNPPSPVDAALSPQFKPLTTDTNPKSPQYILAETWAQAYLVSSIPSAASSSTSTCTPSRIRATVPLIRAYHLWHHQHLPLHDIAGHLRDPPLALSTVGSYIAQAIDLEKLTYRSEDLREVLMVLPLGLRMGRYKRLVESVSGR